jgi:hypothetical protein
MRTLRTDMNTSHHAKLFAVSAAGAGVAGVVVGEMWKL